MAYKYFIENPQRAYNTGQIWQTEFQAFINEQFYNAPDAFVIQEEVVFGSEIYEDVEVRVNQGINVYTGEKLGDDFKLMIFKDLQHSTSIGFKYYFDENYWLVINSEIIKNFAAACLVRRCNNVLRWLDSNGVYHTEPCAIDYELARPRDQTGAVNPVVPQGYVSVYCQGNARTRTIRGNQRFIFGNPDNWVSFKVFGDGVRNFLNQKTFDNYSNSMIKLVMGGHFVNTDTDDIVNGIADAYLYNYAVDVAPTSISGSPGNSLQLSAIVTSNGIATDKIVAYSSSSSAIADVSGSGLVTLISTGSCSIRCSASTIPSVYTDVSVVVSASPIGYNIKITPTPDFILEGNNQTYLAELYDGGALQSGSFVFSDSNSTVPHNYYNMNIISGSAFNISNIKRYLVNPLVIDCTSGSYARQISIDLKGGW